MQQAAHALERIARSVNHGTVIGAEATILVAELLLGRGKPPDSHGVGGIAKGLAGDGLAIVLAAANGALTLHATTPPLHLAQGLVMTGVVSRHLLDLALRDELGDIPHPGRLVLEIDVDSGLGEAHEEGVDILFDSTFL